MLDLAKFFHPASVAIVGVSRKMAGLGGLGYLSRLVESRFEGRLYPINPHAREILGLRVYPSLSALPETPDLTIVCVPAAATPGLLEECARIGARHVHILTSGFGEIGTEEGRRLERQIADLAAEHGLLIMGPNCMGPYCPSCRLTAWGAIPGQTGPLGIVSQSGGITQRLTEYACSLGVGVHAAASIGNATVLDVNDHLEYLAAQEEVRVLGLYLESVRDGRRLLELVRTVNRRKPVVVLKGGETEAGAATVASHTGSMAGESKMWEAFFRQTGAIHVGSLNEWMDAMLAFCHLPPPRGRGVFLTGGGGGNSVLHGDTCVREGLEVPRLTSSSMERLRPLVPVAGSIAGNPLDFWSTFDDPACLAQVLEIAYTDPGIDMVIVDRLIPRKAFHMPDAPDTTAEVIEWVGANRHRKPTIFTVDSDGGDEGLAAQGTRLRARFCEAGIPAYPSLDRAARALAHAQRHAARLRGSN